MRKQVLRKRGREDCWGYKFQKEHSTPRAGNLLSAAAVATILRVLTMKGLLLLTLSSLLCWVSDQAGQNTYCTGSSPPYLLVRLSPSCGATKKACQDTFNQTNCKLCLTYNTTCCDKDKCNSPALRPTPSLALVLLTSLAGLGLCLLR